MHTPFMMDPQYVLTLRVKSTMNRGISQKHSKDLNQMSQEHWKFKSHNGLSSIYRLCVVQKRCDKEVAEKDK